jgi:uncharacterized membrane protein (UPF0182 family)
VSSLAPRAPIRRTLRALRPLLYVAALVAVVAFLVSVYVRLQTNVWWFDSIGYSDAYGRRLVTQIVMFVLFGGVTAIVVGAALFLAVRVPALRRGREPGRIRRRWLALSLRARAVLLAVLTVVAGVRSGSAAASHWQLWLLWRNAVPFGRTDPEFGRDYSYYVFVEPFHRYVVGAATSALLLATLGLLVVGVLQGSLQLRLRRVRCALGLRPTLSVLVALLCLAKAAAYWLDRLATVVSNRGPVTGQSYTDLHVVLPAKLGLALFALVVAAVLVANVWLGSLRILLGSAAALLVVGWLVGGVVPSVVQGLVVKPAAVTKESTTIARNIAATRFGYGVDATRIAPTTSAVKAGATGRALGGQLAQALQPRLLDPNVVNATFTLNQQRVSYYGFKSTLDVDRYDIGGSSVDEAIGVRELQYSNLAGSQKSWTNAHLVYTHGYGVVAAPIATATGGGQPVYDSADIPATSPLGAGVNARIYFGQLSTPYSIVGSATGKGVEFDRPDAPSDYADTAGGGVPIGSAWRRLVYSLQFRDKNLLVSSRINSASQLLYRRTPSARIAAVAPWLKLDGDVYPVVTGTGVTWVADGYTTTNMLPDSQRLSLRSITSTTYVKNGASVPQPAAPINYIRNDVVGTVDATTGKVSLYVKPGTEADPVLQAWMHAFPGLVQPASSFPSTLLPHLRYPQDLFNAQRAVLAKYHVLDPATFYAGTQFWTVSGDPTVSANTSQPSYYATTNTGSGPQFTLRTPFLTLSGNNVAAELSVDCDPGPGYGRLVVTEIPSTEATESPPQLQNDIESDTTISRELSLERQGGSQVRLGNLQTVVVDGQVLAVEPIYTLAASGKPYPLLKHVVVRYGTGPIGFKDTFPAALAEAVGSKTADISAVSAQLQQVYDALQRDQANGDQAAVRHDLATLGRLIAQLQSSA